MLTHFNCRLREKDGGYKLRKDNFATDSNKSGLVPGTIIPSNLYQKYLDEAPINFDYNMNFYSKLSKIEFNDMIENLVNETSFVEITNLQEYAEVSGLYAMIIGEYCQIYIGKADNIKKRILRHWSQIMPLDRLIFGDTKRSRIGIDSFRALDTSKILVYPLNLDEAAVLENKYIEKISDKFLINRTIGGNIAPEVAIGNMKLRKL